MTATGSNAALAYHEAGHVLPMSFTCHAHVTINMTVIWDQRAHDLQRKKPPSLHTLACLRRELDESTCAWRVRWLSPCSTAAVSAIGRVQMISRRR